ncbi:MULTISPECIES: hypothetical protein, partial [unclassified Frankia]|uniref:hypothetical protein n=1 Tax=unclassified Frankia TaxID=2632575 RepID=UPI002023F2C5
MTRAAWPRAEAERALPRISPFRLLRRRWLVIILGAVVGAVCALAVSKQRDERFEATGRVFLGASQALPSSDHLDAARIVQTQAQLAGSTVTLDLAAKQLGLPRREVAERLTITASERGDFFTITGRGDTEQRATGLVQAVEAAYQQLLTQQQAAGGGTARSLTELRDEISQNLRRLAALPRTADGQTLATQVATLNAQLAELNRQIPQVQATGTPAAVTLAEPASPVGKVAPKLARNTLVGALAGLLLTVAGLCATYLRRPTVLDAGDAADVLGAPLIASISGGRGNDLPAGRLVAAMASVLAPTGKVIALTPAGRGDLAPDLVTTVAASWSDDQGIVLILDASPEPDMRGALERLPPAVSSELPRWAHEPTCMARSSGAGSGHVLYNRVAQARAARPGGLVPILADRAPVVDLVIVLTPPLVDLPMTAASAMQADVVIAVATGRTRIRELSRVLRDWPALAERLVGVVHDGRPGTRRPAGRGAADSGFGVSRVAASPVVVPRAAAPSGLSREDAASGSADSAAGHGGAP